MNKNRALSSNEIAVARYNGRFQSAADKCGCGKKAIVGLPSRDKKGRLHYLPRCREHIVAAAKKEGTANA